MEEDPAEPFRIGLEFGVRYRQAGWGQGLTIQTCMMNLLPLLDAAVLPGITHWNHPRFFAYFPSNTTFASVLADLVAAGLGVQGMSWQTSPAATELEEVAMEWLRQLVGQLQNAASDLSGVSGQVAQAAAQTAGVVNQVTEAAESLANGGRQQPPSS